MNAQTKTVTVNAIMMSKPFKIGYADAYAGKFNPDQFECGQMQWRYERGWQFCRALKFYKPEMLTPKMPLENKRLIATAYRNEFYAQRQAENIL